MPSRQSPRVRPGLRGGIAVSLAALPALIGPIAYGANRWWIAGLLALLSFTGLAYWAAVRPRELGPWRGPVGFAALTVWCAWLAVLGALHAPVPHASLLGGLHAASCLASGLVVADITSRTSKGWNLLACLLCLTLILEASYGIVQHFQESPYVLFARKAAGYASRESGTYLCPNHFANLLALGMCATLGFIPFRNASFSVRLFSGAALVLSLPALFLSQSRTGIVSGLIGVWITLVALAAAKSWKRSALVLICLPLVLLPSAFWLAKSSGPLAARLSAYAIQGDLRFRWWRDIPDMMRDSPALGWGTGTFPDVAAGYRTHFVDVMTTLNHAHNEGLQIAVEQGLPGLAVAGLCLLMCAVSGVRMFRLAKENGTLPVMAGWIGCIVVAGLHSMLDFNLRIFANNHVLVMVFALASAGAAPIRRKGATADTAGAGQLRWKVVIVPVALAGMALCALTWIGSLYQLQAQISRHTLVQNLPDAYQALTKGRRIDRLNPFFPQQLAELYADQAQFLRDPGERKLATDEAERWLDQAEKLNPHAFQLFQGRIEVLLLRGDAEGALAAARRMTERFSAVVDCFIQVGDILAGMGRIEEAGAAYFRAWERSGGYVRKALLLHMEMLQLQKARAGAPAP